MRGFPLIAARAISFGFLLQQGYQGPAEQRISEESGLPVVRMRKALGAKVERSLQWSPPISYALEDLEAELNGNDSQAALESVEAKRGALRWTTSS